MSHDPPVSSPDPGPQASPGGISTVGVPRETFPDERRVAVTPLAAAALAKAGLRVLIESGAGEAAGFPDDAYREKDAEIVSSREEAFGADVVVQVRTVGVNAPGADRDLALTRQGLVVVGLANPLGSPEAAAMVAERGATLFALELLPRITRAQGMDVLSSQATVSGYRAALLAATQLPKMFPLLTTAAGTIAPARVLVLGAGVAGLQAIATSRRLGAVVEAYDVRPAAAEEVKSLGARFVELALETGDAQDAGGYAKAQGEEFYTRQRELLAEVVANADAVITTAAVPGRPAPLLVTAAAVRGMAPGSVVVDMAAPQGGNCELTRPDETVVENGVTVLGPTNLPSMASHHASLMFGKNVSSFLTYLIQEGRLREEPDDPIVSGTLVCRDGRVVNPAVQTALEAARGAERQEVTS